MLATHGFMARKTRRFTIRVRGCGIACQESERHGCSEVMFVAFVIMARKYHSCYGLHANLHYIYVWKMYRIQQSEKVIKNIFLLAAFQSVFEFSAKQPPCLHVVPFCLPIVDGQRIKVDVSSQGTIMGKDYKYIIGSIELFDVVDCLQGHGVVGSQHGRQGEERFGFGFARAMRTLTVARLRWARKILCRPKHTRMVAGISTHKHERVRRDGDAREGAYMADGMAWGV